jgi:pimeloyl-ACP methyl ester carboxylesterase
LFGDASPVVTAEDAALLERTNPRANVVSVAHSGHMIPWDNLGETVAEIELFISKLGAGA